MKFFSRITVLFLVLSLLTMFLISCGPEDDDENDTAKENSSTSQTNTENGENNEPSKEEKPDGYVDDSDEDFKGGDIIIIG